MDEGDPELRMGRLRLASRACEDIGWQDFFLVTDPPTLHLSDFIPGVFGFSEGYPHGRPKDTGFRERFLPQVVQIAPLPAILRLVATVKELFPLAGHGMIGGGQGKSNGAFGNGIAILRLGRHRQRTGRSFSSH